jgi:hypothetical protein
MKDTFATEWVEAFYDISYTTAGLKELAIDQARVAEKKSRNKTDLHVRGTNFANLTRIPIYFEGKSGIASPFSNDYFDDYIFQRVDKFKKGNDTLVKISFIPSPVITNPIKAYGSFLYNTSQNSLMSMTLSFDSGLGMQERNLPNEIEVSIKNPKHTFEFQFSSENKNLFERINVSLDYNLIVSGKSHLGNLRSTLFVYQRGSKRNKKLFKPGPQFDFFNAFNEAKYRPRFWKNNLIIKLTQQEEEIIASFEKDNSFGTYFKGKKR